VSHQPGQDGVLTGDARKGGHRHRHAGDGIQGEGQGQRRIECHPSRADALGPDGDATGHRSRQVHQQVDRGVGRHAPLAAQKQPIVAHRHTVQPR
jgi:hypothetical protein